MRTWIKSACVVLAWSILPVIVMTAGTTGSARLTQANTRTASSTEVILTSTLNVAAAPTTATNHTTKYVVQDGDTLSAVATRLAVPGGWPALYAANRRLIGPDPDVIRAGTVLTLPRLAASPSAPAPSSPTPGQAHQRQRPPAPKPSPRASASSQPRPLPAARRAPAATGMPQWLKIVLLAVVLLILAAFLTEPLVVVGRRRRQRTPVQALRLCPSGSGPGPGRGLPSAERVHIVLADYDRLVVTRSQRDGTVYVLRPPGEDPKAILRVARLVVPESGYGELARKLGIPASWPME
jgi:LysM repeat protein